jgi:hypothetical protein
MIEFIGTVISCDNNPKNTELLRIPLLKDVFERYPTTPINIDVKENNDELIRQVIEFNYFIRNNLIKTIIFRFRNLFKNIDVNI